MCILQTFTPDVEIYSIDEAFLDLSHLPLTTYDSLAKVMYDTVLKQIDIPITIGIAPTKTLAKVANRVAKRQRSTHLTLKTPEEINTALMATNVGDVWGVGRALAPKLKRLGMYTAHDLARQDPRWARKNMTVTGERLVRELQGMSCIPFNVEEPDRQSIQVARSFGVRLEAYGDIAEAISTHATRLGEQLRKRKLVTPTISVFCRTSPFSNKPYYKGVGITGFDIPTNDTPTLISGAMNALQHAYQPGHAFQSAGIHATDLVKEGSTTQKQLFTGQPNLQIFGAKTSIHSITLNQAIDAVNQRHGKDTVFWASSGIKPRHAVKQSQRSHRFTTRWDELAWVI